MGSVMVVTPRVNERVFFILLLLLFSEGKNLQTYDYTSEEKINLVLFNSREKRKRTTETLTSL